VLGIRRGEALGLIWEFVDEDPLQINLEWQCICGGRAGHSWQRSTSTLGLAMAILGHSRIALTMKIYVEAPEQATRDALGRLSGWLDKADGGQPDSAV
jgi:hypothetical protein